MQKAKFDISGMTCSSCVVHVEKAVKNVEGIKNVNVNLLSNSMIVEFDDSKVNTENIINAVKNAGYSANISENNKKSNSSTLSNNKLDENIKNMKKRLIISICFLIPLMYISIGNMLNHMFGFPILNFVKNFLYGTENAISFAFSQLLLLLPILYLNRNYFVVGFKRLFNGSPNMDSLIALGSFSATLYGIIVMYILSYSLGHNMLETVDKFLGDIYFESAGAILTLITVGKYFETKSKGKTNDAIRKLIDLTPKVATVIKNGKEIELKVEDIILEDIVLVKPGGAIPIDGVVIEGSSSVDQSAITGESIPIHKSLGDNVISGTINKNGYLKIKVTKTGENTTLAQIIKLVEEAGNSKAPIAKIADKVSGVFVPVVIAIAFIATIAWLLTGQSFAFALTMGISVLVISCPCALGLATPVAIMVGTGKGAENGILIKDAESLEMLHLVDTVILDKTGTITEGRPVVKDIITKINEKDFLKIAGSLEKNSEHPLADAVIERLKSEKLGFLDALEFTSISGKGIKGKINNVMYYAGNLAFMNDNDVSISSLKEKSDELLSQGKTLMYFAKEKELLGIISVSDTEKKSSFMAINELRKRKFETVMLTGDNKTVADVIGKKLNIDKVIAEVLPQDKEKVISDYQKQGKKVAFVGDGINDSPALVRADVGIAIGSGTDIAIESADIVLMKNTLSDVVTAIDLSKSVIKNIKMNLFWAFFYNIIGIPIAAGVFFPVFGLKLSPMLGATAMSLSSICVVTNALRLRNFKSNFGEEIKKDMLKTISIDGMQCNHCKMAVEKVLNSFKEVNSVTVSLEEKNAVINLNNEINNDVIKKAIEDEGFVVKSIN